VPSRVPAACLKGHTHAALVVLLLTVQVNTIQPRKLKSAQQPCRCSLCGPSHCLPPAQGSHHIDASRLALLLLL
jgi:hypothetical protein